MIRHNDPIPVRKLLWVALLVLVWALELLAVQEYTSSPHNATWVNPARCIAQRMVFNLLLTTFCVCVLRPILLYAFFGAGLVLSNILIVYSNYFNEPLSWPVIINQCDEGMQFADHAISLIQWPAVLVLIAVLAIKVGLVRKIRQLQVLDSSMQPAGWTALAAYVFSAIVLAGYVKPIENIQFATPEYFYGYDIAWITEGLFFNKEELLKYAMEAAKKQSNRLSPMETPLELGERVAIIQVESLDWDVLDARVQNEWVMPFLHELKSRSQVYAVCPSHKKGSSDADFATLTGCMPNGKICPFKVEGFPYQNTLPQLASQLGYTCIAMHGNTGNFFYRRSAYEEMHFSEIYFAEELGKIGCPMRNHEVEDAELLNLSAKWLRKTTRPTLHFVITLTSHGPFKRLRPEERELFPESSNQTEAYLNSMRYVDRALASYEQELPDQTTLIIYGDHESRVEGYKSLTTPCVERVPWLVYCKGRNLADNQKTRNAPWAQSGDIQMLDAITYLHQSFHNSAIAKGRVSPEKIASAPSNSDEKDLKDDHENVAKHDPDGNRVQLR